MSKEKLINVKDILTEWLAQNEYDGLASQECGCGLDDLICCEEVNIYDCVAAQSVLCDGTCPNCSSTVGVDKCYRPGKRKEK